MNIPVLRQYISLLMAYCTGIYRYSGSIYIMHGIHQRNREKQRRNQ